MQLDDKAQIIYVFIYFYFVYPALRFLFVLFWLYASYIASGNKIISNYQRIYSIKEEYRAKRKSYK